MTRLAVVTGSNKGIGFAIARNLCEKFDGTVMMTARDEGRGMAAVAKLKEQGLSPVFHLLDIDNRDSIKALRQTIEKEYKGLDVLVNNAAIAYPNASTVPFLEQATNTVRTNFFSLLDVCDELFPLLRPHARVVNLSSSAGMLARVEGEEMKKRFSNPNLTIPELRAMMEEYIEDVKKGCHIEKGWPITAYCSSKVAVSALSFIQQRHFDKDSREDIVVNAVHPGYVDTDMTNHKGPLTIEEVTFCAFKWMNL